MTTQKLIQSKNKGDTIKKRPNQAAIEKRIAEQQVIWLEEYAKYWTIEAACRSIGISRNAVYEWLKKYPDFVLKKKEQEKVNVEFVESQLYSAIKEKNMTAIIFFLKNRARQKWGAEERHRLHEEITHTLKLTDDQRTEIKKLIAGGKV